MGRQPRLKWVKRAKRAGKGQTWVKPRLFQRALAKLGLTAALLLLWATPSYASVVAQKDLPPPPCGCVWDIVNNPFDDPVQTAAEIEADKLNEGDPEWVLSCRDFTDIVVLPVSTGPAIVIYVPPNLPPVGVTPFSVPPGTPPTGVPFSIPPGGTPPIDTPPVQTAEAATGLLLLAGLTTCGLLVPIRRA